MENSTKKRMALWKKVSIGFVVLVFMSSLLVKFQNEPHSVENNEVKALFNLKDVSGKPINEVEKIFGKGKLESKWKDRRSGCKACPKYLFQDGKYEVIFINDIADRITVNGLSKYDFTNELVMGILGLPYADPSFQNDFVKRWNNHEGYREIAAFEDKKKVNYILVLSKAE